jgi:hypothetical protein
MSDLLEALKDTNRLIEAILNGYTHSATLAEARVRAQSLTDRIIEASRQAGAVGVKEDASAVVDRCLVDRSMKAMTFALLELEGIATDMRTVAIDRAIRHLKIGLEGGAA